MDITNIMYLLAKYTSIIASSDTEDGAALIPLVLALSGVIFYAAMYSRYRNADKRFLYEKKTSATVANLIPTDNFLQKRKGLTNASLRGANHKRVEGALNRGSGSKLLEKVEKFTE
ncbi:MAG: hypothetical protein FWD27_07980 [Coriobacteriia bacterium]|nr:hypothetical protein [Coriobacteriia bacterium]